MERKVGYAKIQLKTHKGLRIPGYFEGRYATGEYDPAYVIAIAFEEDGDRSVLISSDTLGFYDDYAYEMPKMIGDANGLPADAIFVTHTHSHTAPHIGSNGLPADPAFRAHYMECMREVTRLALEDLKPLKEVRGQEMEAPGITFSRRVKLKNGTYRTWSPIASPNIVDHAGANDDTFRIMRFIREGGKEVVILNFQCHPDNVGGEILSADYPGAFRRAFELEYPNTETMFVQGAEGQMIGVDYFTNVPQDKSIERAYRMGQKLADRSFPAYESAPLIQDDTKMAYGRVKFAAPTKYDPAKLEWAETVIKNHEAGDFAANGAKDRGEENCLISEAYILRSLIQGEIKSVDIIISYLTFAGIAFIGIPGEPFCELGIEVRKGSPYAITNIGCHTNGSEGYFSVAAAYDHGGYEPRNTRFPKGMTERMIEESVKVLNQVHSK